MEKAEKIVLAVIIISLLGAAFYFAVLRGGVKEMEARGIIFPDKNLVLELRFDDVLDTYQDSSGNDNNISVKGTKLENYGCPKGGCLSFDGFNDSLEIPAVGQLENLTDDNNSWTFSVMFKPSGLPRQGKPGYILFRQGWHEGLYYDLGGKMGATLWGFNSSVKGNSVGLGLYSGTKLKEGKWYYLAMAVDGKSKQAKLYLNGKQAGKTLNVTLPMRDYGKVAYYVGGTGKDPYASYGWVDEVRIYDRALFPEEVKILAGWYL